MLSPFLFARVFEGCNGTQSEEVSKLLENKIQNRGREQIFIRLLHERNCRYEGGLSISLSAVISMQPLGIEQADNPHMKAKDVPFHMGYGGLISSKALQNDRPK